MAIVEYLGPFGLQNQVITKTVCKCVCSVCKREWESALAFLKEVERDRKEANPDYVPGELGDICKVCAGRGKPLYPEEAKDRYWMIVDVDRDTLGARGSLTKYTKILALCSKCNKSKWLNFDKLREWECKSGWKCIKCQRAYLGGENHAFPSDIPDIINWTGLGSFGQFVSDSTITIKCKSCPRELTKAWRSYVGWSGRCRKCASKNMWDDPEIRHKLVVNRPVSSNGFLSKPHAELKQTLNQLGMTQFVSEQWIGDRYRVDEIDAESNLIIEFNGDFYHANPNKYDANDLVPIPDNPMYAYEIWDYDRQRMEFLESCGYSIFVVWESDWNNNREQVISDLLNFIDYHEQIEV